MVPLTSNTETLLNIYLAYGTKVLPNHISDITECEFTTRLHKNTTLKDKFHIAFLASFQQEHYKRVCVYVCVCVCVYVCICVCVCVCVCVAQIICNSV